LAGVAFQETATNTAWLREDAPDSDSTNDPNRPAILHQLDQKALASVLATQNSKVWWRMVAAFAQWLLEHPEVRK
jgi:hypothetical protein